MARRKAPGEGGRHAVDGHVPSSAVSRGGVSSTGSIARAWELAWRALSRERARVWLRWWCRRRRRGGGTLAERSGPTAGDASTKASGGSSESGTGGVCESAMVLTAAVSGT